MIKLNSNSDPLLIPVVQSFDFNFMFIFNKNHFLKKQNMYLQHFCPLQSVLQIQHRQEFNLPAGVNNSTLEKQTQDYIEKIHWKHRRKPEMLTFLFSEKMNSKYTKCMSREGPMSLVFVQKRFTTGHLGTITMDPPPKAIYNPFLKL